jgi:hypothetical protein
VLKPGGSVAVATWKDIGPPFSAIADALGRHVSTEAALMMHSPFTLGDGATLAQLDVRRGLPQGYGHRRNDRVHVGIAP